MFTPMSAKSRNSHIASTPLSVCLFPLCNKPKIGLKSQPNILAKIYQIFHIYQIKNLHTKHFQSIPDLWNLVYIYQLATLLLSSFQRWALDWIWIVLDLGYSKFCWIWIGSGLQISSKFWRLPLHTVSASAFGGTFGDTSVKNIFNLHWYLNI